MPRFHVDWLYKKSTVLTILCYLNSIYRNQTQILSSQVDKEVPKPITHLSTIRLLIRASQIVSLESSDRRSLSSPTLDCLDASRAIAETARSIQPSSLRYLDFFEINSFWIGARSLIRYLASDTRQLSVSQDEIVEDFKSILGCLWKHGPRGSELSTLKIFV